MSAQFNDSYTNFTANLGTERDKSAHGEYTRPAYPQEQQNLIAYEYAWLPRRIVDQVANDAFRKWRDWQADPVQIAAIEKTEKRLDIRGTLERAYTDARLRGKSYAYISIKGDEESVDKPLDPERVGKDQLARVTFLSKDEVADGEIDTDPLSDGYGYPKFYQIMSATLVNIHPTRMIVFYGDEKPSSFLNGRDANSVLDAAMPAIKRHDSTVSNVASLVFESRVDVITVPGLANLLSDPETEKQILARFKLMAMMKGNNGLVMLNGSEAPDTPSEEWEQKNFNFATLPDIIEKAQEEVSAAARIPRALLFGTSSGGLGSTGELELSTYYDHVNTLQSNEVQPSIAILDECLIRSALGSRPDDVWYTWASLWQVSDKERSEIGERIANKWSKIAQMIPADALVQAIINDMTESGVGGGIEQSYNDWVAEGGLEEIDTEEDSLDGADDS